MKKLTIEDVKFGYELYNKYFDQLSEFDEETEMLELTNHYEHDLFNTFYECLTTAYIDNDMIEEMYAIVNSLVEMRYGLDYWIENVNNIQDEDNSITIMFDFINEIDNAFN